MAVLNGTDAVVSVAGAIVNGIVNNSIDFTADIIDVTTKDSGGYKEGIVGEKGFALSIDGLVDLSDTTDVTVLFTAWKAGAAVAVQWGNGIRTTGGQLFTGSGNISAMNQSAPKNGAMTWNITIQGTGTPSESTSATTLAG